MSKISLLANLKGLVKDQRVQRSLFLRKAVTKRQQVFLGIATTGLMINSFYQLRQNDFHIYFASGSNQGGSGHGSGQGSGPSSGGSP
jgi:F0F1-type ATP synthase membrane subunit a